MKSFQAFFLFCLCCQGFASMGQVPLRVPPLPELRFTAVKNINLFKGDRWSYMEKGEGLPIICMHGIGGNSMDFRFQLEALSKSFRVIAWNAPGYMLSDALQNENPRCEDYAAALNDFMDALGIQKAYLLGNSFGTRVATCFALHHPDRVIKMVFVGPSAAVYQPSEEERKKYLAFREAQIPTGGISFANNRASALVAPGTSKALLDLVQQHMKATNKAAFLQTARFIISEGYSPEEIGDRINIPVLLICGSEDKVSPLPKHGERYLRYLPKAEMEILEGIGHLPHLECPAKVNQWVADFFDAPPVVPYSPRQQQIIHTIDSLIEVQEQIILKQDTLAMQRFYPDDMRITNPFHQLIDKSSMIARVKGNVIYYDRFEKKVEHYHFEGEEVVLVIGTENVTPSKNEQRDDAGKTIQRRFTECWVNRQGVWARVVRHAHNVP